MIIVPLPMGTIKQRSSSGVASNATITSTATTSSSSSGNDNKPTRQQGTTEIDDNDKKEKRKCLVYRRQSSSSSLIISIIILSMILFVLGSIVSSISNNFGNKDTTLVSSRDTLRRWYNTPHTRHDDDGIKSVTLSYDATTNIRVTFHEARLDSSSSSPSTTEPLRIVSPGPHAVELATTRGGNTRWAVRVGGDALLSVPLREMPNDDLSSSPATTTVYAGTFSLPIPGAFTLQIYRSGSDDDSRDATTDGASTIVIGKTSFTVEDDPERRRQQQPQPGPYLWNRDSLFAPSHWLSIDFLKRRYPATTLPLPTLGRYIWMDPTSTTPHNPRPLTLLPHPIVKEGTLRQNATNDGFHSFSELSNYELVCFFGSPATATATWGALRSLRPALFPHQRPFKFHSYESRNMTHPNDGWDEETERRLRKCKHLLVFTDEWEYGGGVSLSGEEYEARLTTFVGHLLKVLPDDTFPIWIFTMMESPLTPSHCYRGRDDDNKAVGPKSTEHPCNEILRRLFAVDDDGSGNNNASSTFPERVRLADNTDLSTARLLLGDDDDDGSTTATTTGDLDAKARREIVIFNIALRIFVMVGKQVEVWRSNGQIGKVEGLLRHGVKQKEHELVPYKWN